MVTPHNLQFTGKSEIIFFSSIAKMPEISKIKNCNMHVKIYEDLASTGAKNFSIR